jgi:hypothetical protein
MSSNLIMMLVQYWRKSGAADHAISPIQPLTTSGQVDVKTSPQSETQESFDIPKIFRGG